jgi:hypothetical protein
MKHREEEKAEKQWESDILSGLHISHNNNSGSGSGSTSSKASASKTPGSKSSGIKDRTPVSNKNVSTAGSSFGSSVKNK